MGSFTLYTLYPGTRRIAVWVSQIPFGRGDKEKYSYLYRVSNPFWLAHRQPMHYKPLLAIIINDKELFFSSCCCFWHWCSETWKWLLSSLEFVLSSIIQLTIIQQSTQWKCAHPIRTCEYFKPRTRKIPRTHWSVKGLFIYGFSASNKFFMKDSGRDVKHSRSKMDGK